MPACRTSLATNAGPKSADLGSNLGRCCSCLTERSANVRECVPAVGTRRPIRRPLAPENSERPPYESNPRVDPLALPPLDGLRPFAISMPTSRPPATRGILLPASGPLICPIAEGGNEEAANCAADSGRMKSATGRRLASLAERSPSSYAPAPPVFPDSTASRFTRIPAHIPLDSARSARIAMEPGGPIWDPQGPPPPSGPGLGPPEVPLPPPDSGSS